MKTFFLFLLLLPLAGAVAVTPTSLDYGELARGETVTREILIVNTLPHTQDFQITGMYSDTFSLAAGEKKKISIPLEVVDEENGKHTETLRVEEVYSDTLVNAVSIPVVYRITGGAHTDETFNFDGVTTYNKENILFFVILGIAIVGGGIYCWKKKAVSDNITEENKTL